MANCSILSSVCGVRTALLINRHYRLRHMQQTSKQQTHHTILSHFILQLFSALFKCLRAVCRFTYLHFAEMKNETICCVCICSSHNPVNVYTLAVVRLLIQFNLFCVHTWKIFYCSVDQLSYHIFI